MEPIYFIYIGFVIAILYFLIFKIIPLWRRIFGRIYINKKSKVTPEQYKHLSVGAIYSEQQGAYINTLKTGMPKDKIIRIAGEWWGIYDAAEAREKLNYLLNKGFRYYFSTVYKAYRCEDKNEQEHIIHSGIIPDEPIAEGRRAEIQEDLDKAFSQLYNLESAFDELKLDGVIENKDDIERYGVTGWDCGRLNFLTRICHDAGYITEAQAWEYIDRAYDLSKSSFTSWKDFAMSYVIGRAMWGGPDNNNSGIKVIADYLLDDPKSPWKQMEW